MLVGSLECIDMKLDQFRHILLINSIFVNHLQWYWIRHYVFDWFISLIIIKVFFLFHCHWISAYTGFICSTHLFFHQSQEDKREWMSKQWKELKSKVKESFVKLVNFCQSRYIYILCTKSHLVILSHQQSYLVYKLVSVIDLSLYDVAFSVWYLRFSIYWQFFFFLNLALNLSPFRSSLCSFTILPSHFRVKNRFFVKHSNPKSSTKKDRFRKVRKRLSIYWLFIRCAQEKQFC